MTVGRARAERRARPPSSAGAFGHGRVRVVRCVGRWKGRWGSGCGIGLAALWFGGGEGEGRELDRVLQHRGTYELGMLTTQTHTQIRQMEVEDRKQWDESSDLRDTRGDAVVEDEESG